MAQAHAQGQTAGRGFTGWHMIMVLGGAFAVVAAVNVVFVVAALTSWTGEVDPAAYERGLAYNDILDSRAEQSRLGWAVASRLDQGVGGASRLVLTVTDRTGAAVDGAAVSAEIRRPTREGLDRLVTFEETAPGTYAAALDLPLKGQWAVTAVIDRDTDRFELHDRIILK